MLYLNTAMQGDEIGHPSYAERGLDMWLVALYYESHMSWRQSCSQLTPH